MSTEAATLHTTVPLLYGACSYLMTGNSCLEIVTRLQSTKLQSTKPQPTKEVMQRSPPKVSRHAAKSTSCSNRQLLARNSPQIAIHKRSHADKSAKKLCIACSQVNKLLKCSSLDYIFVSKVHAQGVTLSVWVWCRLEIILRQLSLHRTVLPPAAILPSTMHHQWHDSVCVCVWCRLEIIFRQLSLHRTVFPPPAMAVLPVPPAAAGMPKNLRSRYCSCKNSQSRKFVKFAFLIAYVLFVLSA